MLCFLRPIIKYQQPEVDKLKTPCVQFVTKTVIAVFLFNFEYLNRSYAMIFNHNMLPHFLLTSLMRCETD